MNPIVPAVALLLIATSGFPQVKETIEVTHIEVPISVSDAAGNPVRGLTVKDFKLLDNGKPRPITSFDVIDFGAERAPVSALAPVNPIARRSFLLLFDLGYASPNSIVRAQAAARHFVRTALHPQDVVSVGTVDVDGTYRSLTSFTSDRELIASAIENPASFRAIDPLGISNQTVAFNPELEQPGMANLASIGLTPEALGKRAEGALRELQMARNAAHMNEQFARQRVERHVDALGDIAKTLALAPGRKQVILLSEGVPTRMLTGRDARDSKEETLQFERMIHGAWATPNAERADLDTDLRFGAPSTLSLLERMERYFHRSDVVLHAIDLQGARVQQTTFEGLKVNSNNGLATLARVTGGMMFENSNSVGDSFRRLLRRQEVVYILGFQGATLKPGTFHELAVKVSGVSRRAHIDSRSGYYEGFSAIGSRSLSDAEIIVNDIGQSGIRLASFAAPMAEENGRALVPVILEINGSDLADATMLEASANIAVYALDHSGTVRDRIFHELTFDRAKLGDRLRAGGVKYYGTLSLPPGDYAIKTLVRVAKSGRRGYARTNIHVPIAGEFGLVPFMIDDDPANWVMVKGPSRGAPAEYPFQINGAALIPAVLPHIRAGQSRRVALFIQNAEPEQLLLNVTPNATIVETAKTPTGTKIVLQAGRIDAGVHAVEVVVQKAGEAALHARIPVVVEQE